MTTAMFPAEEDVRGYIVGDGRKANRYEFRCYRHDLQCTEFITAEYFDTDAEAEAWFAENYPEYYAHGVEVRCYEDKP